MLCFLAGVKSELAHGTPSEINTYISMNNCTKFGALIRLVTIQLLSNPTNCRQACIQWSLNLHLIKYKASGRLRSFKSCTGTLYIIFLEIAIDFEGLTMRTERDLHH